jgi:3-phosphoshikimate 1-carboxyvinyltransferase
MTRVEPAGALVGHIAVPGDKSISHRALLIGALTDGETRVRGFGRSADTQSTVDAVRTLGIEVDDRRRRARRARSGSAACRGRPSSGLRQRRHADAAAAGILAGQEGRFELTGDESLRTRPMDRVAEPLTRMGAHRDDDGLPPCVEGSDSLKRIEYVLPVASAQVKSAVLLAG